MFRSYESYQNPAGEYIRALWERSHEDMQDVCVVLCHGRSVDKDELGAFTALSDSLVGAGYDVFRFDFRGQGQSDGEYTSIQTNREDIDTTMAFLHEVKKYSSYILVAASFSGASVLPFVADNKYDIHGLVLWNAVIDMEFANNPSSAMGKQRRSDRKKMLDKLGYIDVGRRVKMSALGYHEMLQAQPRKSLQNITCPIVMIHGTADEHVPFELSVIHAAQHTHVHLYPIQGGKHGFPLGFGRHEAIDIAVLSINSF